MIAMVPARKRKDPHKPQASPNDKGKVRLVEHSGCDTDSVKPARIRNDVPASRALDNLRRGGIRILSIFRNGKRSPQGTSQLLSSSDVTTSETSECTQSVAIPTSSAQPSIDPTQRLDNPIPLPSLELAHESPSLFLPADITGMDGESEPLLTDWTHHPKLRPTNRSTPSLSRQVTTKISNAVLHKDTVIHRPKLSMRPTIRTTDLNPQTEGQHTTTPPHTTQSDVPSLPSSFPSSSNAPLSQSTAPTSLVSSGAPVSAETTHRTQNGVLPIATRNSPPRSCDPANNQATIHYLVFPRQDAPVLCKVSIATIEKAAAAKIFFESHFNEVLRSQESPRSMRRRQLERRLFALAMPTDQRQRQRRE
ncbi:hypothetical protein ACN47E_004614 [Coniothyrium glycines]